MMTVSFLFFLKLLGAEERRSKSQEENLAETDGWGELSIYYTCSSSSTRIKFTAARLVY